MRRAEEAGGQSRRRRKHISETVGARPSLAHTKKTFCAPASRAASPLLLPRAAAHISRRHRHLSTTGSLGTHVCATFFFRAPPPFFRASPWLTPPPPKARCWPSSGTRCADGKRERAWRSWYEPVKRGCRLAHPQTLSQDTVTGFLLAGVGHVDLRRSSNFFIVTDSKLKRFGVEAVVICPSLDPLSHPPPPPFSTTQRNPRPTHRGRLQRLYDPPRRRRRAGQPARGDRDPVAGGRARGCSPRRPGSAVIRGSLLARHGHRVSARQSAVWRGRERDHGGRGRRRGRVSV